MFSELTDAIIAEMDEKYLDLMESMDSDDFLEELDNEDEAIDYQDVLYISMMADYRLTRKAYLSRMQQFLCLWQRHRRASICSIIHPLIIKCLT